MDLNALLKARATESSGQKIKEILGGMGGYALDMASESVLDPGKMTVTLRISTERIDRSRDVVLGKGIDTTNHQKNPIVLFNHRIWDTPIGRADDEEGNYTVKHDEGGTVATTRFFQDQYFATEVYRLIEMKALNAGSIGFRPKLGKIKRALDENDIPYAVIEECELYEYSHCYVGDNPDALVIAVQKGLGGKPLCQELRDAIMPMLPLGKVWAPGASLPKSVATMQKAVTHPAPPKKPGAAEPAGGVKVKDMDTSGDPLASQAAAGDDDDAVGTIPAGAQFLTGLFDVFCQMADYIESTIGMQENEEVKSLAESYQATIGDHITEVAGVFASQYPDLDPLMDEEDADDDGDTDGEGEGEEKEVEDTDPPKDPKDEEEKSLKLKAKRAALARRMVVKWYARREKKLSKSASGIVTDAADYLDEAGKHAGPWGATHRTAAKSHSKMLRKMLETKEDDDPEAAGNDGDEKALAAAAADLRAQLQSARAGLAEIR